jgi:hypothetical protein
MIRIGARWVERVEGMVERVVTVFLGGLYA